MKKLSLLFCAALITGGCAGPNPTQIRVSLLTWAPSSVTISPAPSTNAPAIYTARAKRDNETQTIAPDMRGGITVLIDNQLAFPNGSGTASSNSTLSDLQIPLTQ